LPSIHAIPTFLLQKILVKLKPSGLTLNLCELLSKTSCIFLV